MSIYALIPALPLAAFVVLALGGRRLDGASHRIGVPAVAASFGLSIAALFEVARSGPVAVPLYRFVATGDFVIDIGLHVDQLAVLLLPLVTGVSFIVHVYSARYMIGDPRYRRFFAVMALFTFAMALLVTSNNLLVTYMCWELMGICSYLLISHWAQRPAAGRAATKAFLVNAVADVGLGFGVVLTFATYGTLDIQEILAQASAMSGQSIEVLGLAIERNTLITLCLLSGAMGKSAQVPMHVWLPFAMEAPTPVSALIHAATMVNAGPFLLVRMSPLVMLAPPAMVVIAIIGAVTALFGALVALTQSDIKKLLAFSTISQIGFMIFACGVGAFSAAVFHLLAHGFLKGFLFLSTGTALEAATGHAHGEESVPASRLRPLAVGALLLTCVPVIVVFSGPYEQLWTAQQVPSAGIAFWVVAVVTIFLTAVYAFRAIVSLFGAGVGSFVTALPRLSSRHHLPAVAVVSIAVAALLVGAWSWLGAFLAPALGGGIREAGSVTLSPLLVVPLAAAVAGWALAYARHLRPAAVPFGQREWVKSAYVHFLNRLYFDELHDACAVRPTLRLSRWLWRGLDLRWVDRTVLGTARGTRVLAESLHRLLERKVVDPTVHAVATVTVRLARWLWSAIDVRRVDAAVERGGRLAADVGAALRGFEPRTMRQNLWIVVYLLVAAIGISYWFTL